MTRFEELTFETLIDNITHNDLPEGGFIMDDSHMLTFVPSYFEDEMYDPDEIEYDDLFVDTDTEDEEEY